MRRNVSFVLVLVGAALSSSVGLAADPTVKQLKKARAQVAVDGAILGLEARVWRDAKPGAPADDALLAAAIKVRTEGNQRLPVGLRIDGVWLIKGNELWAPAEHKDETQSAEPGQPTTYMTTQVSGGPKWKPGTKVICVIRIAMSDGGEGLLKIGDVAVSNVPPATAAP